MIETITSRQNALLVKTVRLQTSKKFRKETGLCVGDGVKLLKEALRWAPDRLHTVILQEDVSCPPLPEQVRKVQISRQLMKEVSQMENPEGALFLFQTAEESSQTPRPGCLALEGVQDPGNLGTILRTADAMDVPVFLLEGCCDPYGPKTVRATMGAIFRTPPTILTGACFLQQCRKKSIPVLAATLSVQAKDLRNYDLKQAAVIIGSEGQGVSAALLRETDDQLIIPMHIRCESLNAAVAAAIILWQMTPL